MDVYAASKNYLATILSGWKEIDELLVRVTESRPHHWKLPALICTAVGGEITQSIPAVAALGCIYLSIILIDDMLDSDPKGEHLRLGFPVTSNIASALQAAGLEAIARSAFANGTKEMILSNLNQMILQTAIGQHWDMQNPQDEESYWRVTRSKSSPFFASSFLVGALAGGATSETALALGQIGGLYGEMVQIHDDINDVMDVPANSDWTQGRSPLPILFAQVVSHPEQNRFKQLRWDVGAADALAEAQHILVRCGALSYAIHELLTRYNRSIALASQLNLVRQSAIIDLLEEIAAPVCRLLKTVEDDEYQPSFMAAG